MTAALLRAAVLAVVGVGSFSAGEHAATGDTAPGVALVVVVGLVVGVAAASDLAGGDAVHADRRAARLARENETLRAQCASLEQSHRALRRSVDAHKVRANYWRDRHRKVLGDVTGIVRQTPFGPALDGIRRLPTAPRGHDRAGGAAR